MTKDSQKIAVTGGAGFIGRHFCTRLHDQGRLLSTLDIRAPANPMPGIRHVTGDVRDARALRETLTGASAVLHLAAAHHDFGIERDTYYDVNAGSARTLCDVLDEQGIRTLCFFSSVAVYGSAPGCPDEATEPQPDSPYGASKLAGEHVFQEWAAQGDGRSVLVIRPTVTFGPGHFANVYTLIRQIASRAFVRVGPGRNHKSLVYIDNIIDATLALWARPDAPAFDVFNVVDKPDLSSREIAEAIYVGLGRKPPKLAVPMWLALLAAKPFDLVIALTRANLPISSARVKKFAEANTVFSADKLAAAGITPTVPLAEGLRRMVKWYVEEGRALPVDRSIPPARTVPLEAPADA